MPGLYIGGMPPTNFGNGPIISRGGISTAPNTTPAPTPGGFPTTGTPSPSSPGVLGAQAVRPTGPFQGFDPSYLQNLATAIGGLFSRPQGNLSFNPLGNLSEISPPTGFGTAPVPGLPNTMLQDAINGLSFMFQPPAPPSTSGSSFVGSGGGGGGDNGGRRSLLAY